MEDIAIFRINYKSDFILTLQSDAGWMIPFCIKFWTGAPSQAYYAYYDGMNYTHCAPVEGEPTKLLVQFDDHHLPIGDLKFQIGYHFTVDDFPTSVEDEVLNQASVIIEVDDAPAQVMLDLNGETAPEIEFSLPAYTNEQQRIANEEQRIAAESIRIVNEESRIAAETTRQQNEAQRISNEESRVAEFARLNQESETATADANAAATLANEKAALAADKAALAQAAATLANDKAQLAADKAALAQAAATLANDKADLAQQKAAYAQAQGDYAKEQGDTAQADHVRAESDHTRAESDHAAVEMYVDSLGAFDISAYHATGSVLAKYADLTDAIGINGANIPDALRKGGMSVKFVQSSDNKYVQYHLMTDDWSTNTEDWSLYSEDILVNNNEFIEAHNDNKGNFLYGVRKDAEFIFGTGIPAKIKKYILDRLSEKVNKEDGKGLSTNDYTNEDKNIVSSFRVIENNEYICAIVDSSDNFIWGISKNGKVRYGAGIPTEIKNYIDRLGLTIIIKDGYLKIERDFDDKVTKTLDNKGTETIYNKTQLKGDSKFHGSIKVNNKAGNSLKESTSFNITSINALNPYDYYFPRLLNMSFKNSKSETNIKPLVICQISDIHGYITEYNRIVDFLSLYKGVYDDVIITGDIVESHFADSIDFLNAYDNKALLEIGNHDAWERNALPIVIVDQKQVYDKFLAPFISNWGVVQPINAANDGKCYYYKDYPLSKIRLIVLDCMHDSQDQLDFVVSSLNGAKTLGYSVIASQHYAAGTGTLTDVPFDTLDNLGYEYNSYFVNAVDDFINNGGKFICWMCGHHHQDLFGYIDGHPNQLQICIDCACDRNNYDTARIRGTKSQDSFTFYSFDTSLGIFTMLRVGATFDRHLRKKDVLVWDYVNKNIVL